MAVIQIKEIAKSRDGEARNDGSTRWRRVCRVYCNDPDDNGATVVAAVSATSGFTPSDSFPGDATAYPKSYRPTQEHEMLIWLCEIEYSNDDENPLNEPAELKVSGQLFSEVMVVDANGDPVLNSAGDPFIDPPIEKDRARGLITFTKNTATPPAWVFSLQNSLNLAGFTIWGGAISVGASKAKFREPEITGPHERNGTTYYTVSGTIEVDDNGWDANVLDAGWRQKSGSDRVAIVNADGSEPQQPVPLDGSGGVLANPSAASAVILTFERYLPTSWSSLVALLV